MSQSIVLQMALARGVGDVTIKHVISFLETNGYTWDDLTQETERLLLEMNLRPEIVRRICEEKVHAQQLFEQMNADGIMLLVENDSAYPQYLKQMLGVECPPLLFAKGNLSLLNQKSVGFCGSRKASPKGLRIAESCAEQLASRDVVIVSGYASGTDMTAHSSALRCGGTTVFVLAEGILRAVEKKEIKSLLNNQNHIFISQFLPNVSWNIGNAMKRNNIIIGLSRAMILVESGKTGGTFAAGEQALKVGCPLFVIDFEKPEVSAEANAYFIEKGGLPIRGKNQVPNMKNVFYAVEQDPRKATKVRKQNEFEQLKMDIAN